IHEGREILVYQTWRNYEMEGETKKKIWSELILSGHLATRVLTTLVVIGGFYVGIWGAADKYSAKADIVYVDKEILVVAAKGEINKEKSNYIIRKSLEAQTAQRALLEEKIRAGKGGKYDAETIKYLNEDIRRLQELLEK